MEKLTPAPPIGTTVAIQCRGIAAIARRVNTVVGPQFRCERCGGAVKVVA